MAIDKDWCLMRAIEIIKAHATAGLSAERLYTGYLAEALEDLYKMLMKLSEDAYGKD